MGMAASVTKSVLFTLSFALGASLFFSGCSLMTSAKTEPSNRYVLNEVPQYLGNKGRHSYTILIAAPETSSFYDTRQIAYSDRPHRIAYYADNQWAATPAQMFQPLLQQTLQNTHYYHAVVTAPFQGYYDYQLTTQIIRLQMDFTRKPAMLNFTVLAQLLGSAGSNRVIASKEFSVSEPVIPPNPYGGVLAANRAGKKILRDIAEFAMTRK